MDEGYCTNCDGRKCMDCVLRVMHDECVDDCPFCCATPLFELEEIDGSYNE